MIWEQNINSNLCSHHSFVRGEHLLLLTSDLCGWKYGFLTEECMSIFNSKSLLNVPSVLERWEGTQCGATQWSWKCKFCAIAILFELQMQMYFVFNQSPAVCFLNASRFQWTLHGILHGLRWKRRFKTPKSSQNSNKKHPQTKCGFYIFIIIYFFYIYNYKS